MYIYIKLRNKKKTRRQNVVGANDKSINLYNGYIGTVTRIDPIVSIIYIDIEKRNTSRDLQ
jgi:hypothetical protein